MVRASQAVSLITSVLLGVGLEFFVSSVYTAIYVTFTAGAGTSAGRIDRLGEVIFAILWLPVQIGIVLCFSKLARIITLAPFKRWAFFLVFAPGIALTIMDVFWFLGLLPVPVVIWWMGFLKRMSICL